MISFYCIHFSISDLNVQYSRIIDLARSCAYWAVKCTAEDTSGCSCSERSGLQFVAGFADPFAAMAASIGIGVVLRRSSSGRLSISSAFNCDEPC